MNKEVSTLLQRVFILLLFAYFLFAATLSYAQPIPGLPFHIFPQAGTTLPTTVIAGNTATAFYTVRNHTLEQRNGNFVKYLPPNVEQDTGVGSTCGLTFNLTPEGQAGDSCTLKLTIFGPVDGNDPDPHHHLFVCFPGGITCAGTVNSLNVRTITTTSVAITPVTATITVPNTQQYTAIATFSDGSTQNVTVNANTTWQSSNPAVATINPSTGLAQSVSGGTTTITAVYNGVTSNGATLTVAPTLVSIAVTPLTASTTPGGTQQFTATGTFTDGSTADITTSVTWASSDTTVATITSGASGGVATGVAPGTTNITATSGAITSSPPAVLTVTSLLYVVNNGISISFCGVQSNGAFTCMTTSAVAAPQRIALNPSGTRAYVTTNANTVFVCATSTTFGLTGCVQTEPPPPAISGTIGPITINPTDTFAYIADSANIYRCVISASDGTLSACSITASGVTSATGLVVNSAGTFLYVTRSTGGNTFVCPIDGTTGALSPCTVTGNGFSNPVGIAFKNGIVYVTNNTAIGSVASCTVTNPATGALSCTNTGTAMENPAGIAINFANTFAYVSNQTNNTVTYCAISGGAFNSCTPLGGFSSPFGIAIH